MQNELRRIIKRNVLILCLAVIFYFLLLQVLVLQGNTSASATPDITISCSAGCTDAP